MWLSNKSGKFGGWDHTSDVTPHMSGSGCLVGRTRLVRCVTFVLIVWGSCLAPDCSRRRIEGAAAEASDSICIQNICQEPLPVPSLKQVSARFLWHWEAAMLFCCTQTFVRWIHYWQRVMSNFGSVTTSAAINCNSSYRVAAYIIYKAHNYCHYWLVAR